jgi:RNA polymerase sigma factor, sigma-70 family
MEEEKRLYNEFILGNNDAFEQIMNKYRENLIYFIQRIVKSFDVAEDIAQDVFVYVLINKKEYDFKYTLKTYLYTIGRSRAINYLKKEKRCVSLNLEHQGNYEIEEIMFLNERKRNLKESINKLLPQHQLVIYLAEIEELPYKEICKIMNKSMVQIKMLIYRARKNLKIILGKESNKYEE